MYKTDDSWEAAPEHREHSLMICDDLGRGERAREAQEGGDIDIIMTDSYCYMAETNTTLQSSYTPIKKKETLWTVTWEINFYDDKVNLFVMANSPLIQYCTLYKLSEIYLSSS